MVSIVLPERVAVSTKRKNRSLATKKPPPNTINHTRTRSSQFKTHSIYGITMSISHCLKQVFSVFFESQLLYFQSSIPITLNERGTHELREEVLSRAGAQDMDTSGYELSDLEQINFCWENLHSQVDVVFRRGVDTPFSPTAFDGLKMGKLVENPILSTMKKKRRNGHPPVQSLGDAVNPLRCCEFDHLEHELKKFPITVPEFCSQKFYCICIFIKTIDNVFLFIDF